MHDGLSKAMAESQRRQTDCSSPSIALPSAKGLLLERAEALRREAHNLETLARQLPPEGVMSPDAERTLTHAISSGLYPRF